MPRSKMTNDRIPHPKVPIPYEVGRIRVERQETEGAQKRMYGAFQPTRVGKEVHLEMVHFSEVPPPTRPRTGSHPPDPTLRSPPPISLPSLPSAPISTPLLELPAARSGTRYRPYSDSNPRHISAQPGTVDTRRVGRDHNVRDFSGPVRRSSYGDSYDILRNQAMLSAVVPSAREPAAYANNVVQPIYATAPYYAPQPSVPARLHPIFDQSCFSDQRTDPTSSVYQWNQPTMGQGDADCDVFDSLLNAHDILVLEGQLRGNNMHAGSIPSYNPPQQSRQHHLGGLVPNSGYNPSPAASGTSGHRHGGAGYSGYHTYAPFGSAYHNQDSDTDFRPDLYGVGTVPRATRCLEDANLRMPSNEGEDLFAFSRYPNSRQS